MPQTVQPTRSACSFTVKPGYVLQQDTSSCHIAHTITSHFQEYNPCSDLVSVFVLVRKNEKESAACRAVSAASCAHIRLFVQTVLDTDRWTISSSFLEFYSK